MPRYTNINDYDNPSDFFRELQRELEELSARPYREKAVLVPRGHGMFSVEKIKVPHRPLPRPVKGSDIF